MVAGEETLFRKITLFNGQEGTENFPVQNRCGLVSGGTCFLGAGRRKNSGQERNEFGTLFGTL